MQRKPCCQQTLLHSGYNSEPAPHPSSDCLIMHTHIPHTHTAELYSKQVDNRSQHFTKKLCAVLIPQRTFGAHGITWSGLHHRCHLNDKDTLQNSELKTAQLFFCIWVTTIWIWCTCKHFFKSDITYPNDDWVVCLQPLLTFRRAVCVKSSQVKDKAAVQLHSQKNKVL